MEIIRSISGRYHDLRDDEGLTEAAEDGVRKFADDKDDGELEEEDGQGEVEGVVVEPDAIGGGHDGTGAVDGPRPLIYCPEEEFLFERHRQLPSPPNSHPQKRRGATRER
ncbi:unnamed protein product, partial [Musa banksii]